MYPEFGLINEMPGDPFCRGQHFLQLFDGPDSMAEAVTAFVQQGLSGREITLLAVTPEHWLAIEQRLRAAGVDIEHAVSRGHLIVRDAARTLRLFERRGRLDPHLFDASIGAQVRELVSHGRHVRIYGEMVDLLAVQGNYAGAQQLESYWNDLKAHTAFTLFCGYSSENFGDPLMAGSLRSICRTHSHVRSSPNDLLGSFLLRTHVEA